MKRDDRLRFAALLAALVLAQFTVRGRFGGERLAPDFLLLALQLYAIRAERGAGAVAGLVLGLLRYALTPRASGRGRWPTRSWGTSRGGDGPCSSPRT